VKIILSHFLFFVLFPFSLSAQDIYDVEHSWKYAEHLYSTKEYENAAKEYERLLFFHPGNDSLLLDLSRSYLHSKQFEKALSLIEPRVASNPSYVSHYLDILLLTGQYEKGKMYCSGNKNIPNEQRNIYNSRILLYTGEWKSIKEVGRTTKIRFTMICSNFTQKRNKSRE
jgi:tetratricopeptide (TPR) repeat protein